MALLSATYNLREEIARMNDVADFVDTFDTVASYTPVVTGSGSMTTTLTTTTHAKYWLLGGGRHVSLYLKLVITTGGTASNQILIALPTTSLGDFQVLSAFAGSATLGNTILGAYTGATPVVVLEKRDGSNFPLEAITIGVSGVYLRS